MISICTAATKSYLYAFPQLLRAIAAAAAHHDEGCFILATDKSSEADRAEDAAKKILPEGWKISVLRMPIEEDAKDYKEPAQIRIARLQGAAFAFARRIKATLCWSVESDTLPPANALRVLEWALQMPDATGGNVYDIAAATYPNGLFLGGFGTPQNPIAEDFLPKERKLKPRLKLCLEKCEERLKGCRENVVAEKEGNRMARLRERVKKSPPDGTIWDITSKHGWRRRGWMDHAYPGIGEGAIVPSDWCGLGCTLLSKKSLALADFSGYDGRGTQDLFLCWHRWHPASLRIACVPHVACDHIKREGAKIIHHRSYHETNPEYKGHLRVRRQEWVAV